jgi:hypothetical protein
VDYTIDIHSVAMVPSLFIQFFLLAHLVLRLALLFHRKDQTYLSELSGCFDKRPGREWKIFYVEWILLWVWPRSSRMIFKQDGRISRYRGKLQRY